MKRILVLILSILVVCCVSFSLAGCGDDKSDSGNGGSNGNYITITYYDEFTAEPQTKDILKESVDNEFSLSKVGYAFKGMYDSKTGGVEIFNSSGKQIVPLAKDTTLYARFDKIEYEKGFVVKQYGSIDDKTLTVSIGDTITRLREPNMMEGFELVGWKLGEDGPLISDGIIVKDEYMHVNETTSSIWFNDTKFYAEVSIKKYIVTFNFNDGSFSSKEQMINHGESVTSSMVPNVVDDANDDKEFLGWSMSRNTYIPYENSVDCRNVTSDINIYAYWRYWKEVKLILVQGEWEETVKIYNDEDFLIPSYNYPGYLNDGWFYTPRFDRAPVTVIRYADRYAEYYARWALADYTISFELNGGFTENGQNSINDITYQMGESFELPELQKDNYVFLGWCEKRDLSDTPKTRIQSNEYGDKELFAKFRGDFKKVVYNLDVGSIAFEYKDVEYGAEYQLDIPIYEGYGFCGWYLDEDFSEQLTDKNGFGVNTLKWKSSEDITNVYGKFAKKYYVTVLHSIEGAGTCQVEDYYIEGDHVTLKVNKEDQYKIKGIMLNNVMVTTKDSYSFAMLNKDMQFTVVYEPNKYTITLANLDGAYISSTSKVVPYGEKYSLPTPIKEGYKFLGWEYDSEYMTEQVTDSNGTSLNAFTFTSNVTFTPCFVSDPSNNDILITSASDFMSIANAPDRTYQLVKDIDMFGKTWTPFDFSGKLNGNGFKIKNLSLASNSGNLAVFNTVTGTINGVTFENLSVNSSCYDHVAVAGVCITLKGTLNLVYASGAVVADDGITAGLVAILEGGTINNCTNALNVTGLASEGDRGTAGIVGIAKSGKILDCENTGKITGKWCTAGILGRTVGNTYTEINNAVNNGDIVSKGDRVGGIIGYYYHTGTYSIQNFTNDGKIEGVNYVGGVIGMIENTYTSSNNNTYTLNLNIMSNSGDVVASGNNIGGLIGRIVLEAYNSGRYNYYEAKQKLVCREFTNTGSVTGELTVGGIIGYVSTDEPSSELIGFLSSAKIKATGIVGGIIGESNNVILQDATNSGTNFILESTYIDGSDKYLYLGGYIGRAYATNVIGAVNQVDISYEKTSCTGSYIGGIAGVSTGTFTDCENSGFINAPNSSYVGGIVGYIHTLREYSLQRLSNDGKIWGISYIGGIIGQINNTYTSSDHNTRTINLNEFTNNGKIIATGNYIGGLIGRIDAEAYNSGRYDYYDGVQMITARKLINNADVTGNIYVGGILGFFHSDSANSEFIEAKSKSNIVGTAYIGGLIGQSENVKISNPDNKNSTITSTNSQIDGGNHYAYIGGYVGKALNTHIENAVNTVSIIYDGANCNGNYIGGIYGYSTGTFTNVENRAIVKAPRSSFVGGIAGEQAKLKEYTIKNVKNSANVTGVNYVAGIFGNVVNTYVSDNHSERFTNFIDVTNEGEVVAAGNYAGGIAGCINAEASNSGRYDYFDGTQAFSLRNVKNSGRITGVDYVGGISGYARTDSTNAEVVSYTQTGTVNGRSNYGRVFGFVENLKLPN